MSKFKVPGAIDIRKIIYSPHFMCEDIKMVSAISVYYSFQEHNIELDNSIIFVY